MAGAFDSLNVATSSGIALHHLTRRGHQSDDVAGGQGLLAAGPIE
jgi:hypothetical protein